MVEGWGGPVRALQDLYASFKPFFSRLKAVRKNDMVDPELQEQVKDLVIRLKM